MITIKDLNEFLEQKGYKLIKIQKDYVDPVNYKLKGNNELKYSRFKSGKWLVLFKDNKTGLKHNCLMNINNLKFQILGYTSIYEMARKTSTREAVKEDFSEEWRLFLLNKHGIRYFNIVKEWIDNEKGIICRFYDENRNFYLQEIEELNKKGHKSQEDEVNLDYFNQRLESLSSDYEQAISRYDNMENLYKDALNKANKTSKRKTK